MGPTVGRRAGHARGDVADAGPAARDRAASTRILKPHGLTFARYEALVLLVFSSRGSLPLGKMGERLQVHPTSVTSIVRRLESSGLVVRRAHPEDGRAVLAEITDAGRTLVEKATRDLVGADFGLGVLGDRELRELSELLRPIRQAAGDF